jgi:hypothetical protein
VTGIEAIFRQMFGVPEGDRIEELGMVGRPAPPSLHIAHPCGRPHVNPRGLEHKLIECNPQFAANPYREELVVFIGRCADCNTTFVAMRE